VSTSTLVLTADGAASSTSNRTSFGSMAAMAAVSISPVERVVKVEVV
jgi:hypothetical protein